jgi:hypothetical protein
MSKKCSKQPKIVQEEIVEDEPEVKKSKKQSKKETTMVEPIKVKKSMNKVAVIEDEVETPKKKGKKSKKDEPEESGDEVVVITKKSNPWIEYVAKFKLKHSELSHKEALVEASKKYKLLKK